jgi:hypothetical protein
MLPGSNSLFQLWLLYWAFQSVNISVAGFDSAFSLNFAFTSFPFNYICVPLFLVSMQRTRCHWWRSNQALYPYYIGFWSWIFWACHKGKYLDRFSLFGYLLCFALICWLTSSSILLIVQMYPQGRMSHHFREMKVGDYLSVKGPKVIIMLWASDVVSIGFFCGHKKALVTLSAEVNSDGFSSNPMKRLTISVSCTFAFS